MVILDIDMGYILHGPTPSTIRNCGVKSRQTSILQNCRFEGLLTQAKRKPGRSGVRQLFPDPGTSHSNPRFLMVERLGASSCHSDAPDQFLRARGEGASGGEERAWGVYEGCMRSL